MCSVVNQNICKAKFLPTSQCARSKVIDTRLQLSVLL